MFRAAAGPGKVPPHRGEEILATVQKKYVQFA
jgi:hypothetical protein